MLPSLILVKHCCDRTRICRVVLTGWSLAVIDCCPVGFIIMCTYWREREWCRKFVIISASLSAGRVVKEVSKLSLEYLCNPCHFYFNSCACRMLIGSSSEAWLNVFQVQLFICISHGSCEVMGTSNTYNNWMLITKSNSVTGILGCRPRNSWRALECSRRSSVRPSPGHDG